MGGATGTGDDDFDAAALGAGGVFEQQVGGAMSRDHAGLDRNLELLERLDSGAHRLPIGGRAHDDADQWFHRGMVSNKPRRLRNSSRDAASRLAGSTRAPPALWMSACSALRSASGHHLSSSSSAAGPSVSSRVRHASTRLCFSASIAESRDFWPTASSMGAMSMSRMSLPMNCRWRARPPRLVMRLASRMAS